MQTLQKYFRKVTENTQPQPRASNPEYGGMGVGVGRWYLLPTVYKLQYSKMFNFLKKCACVCVCISCEKKITTNSLEKILAETVPVEADTTVLNTKS